MTKQEQFLLIVQTSVLSNAINLASIPEQANKYRHEISSTGVFGTMMEAIYVSERIPENMGAADAANEFVTYFLSNQRESEEHAQGHKLECPAWCARY
jgi:hypothetical protein